MNLIKSTAFAAALCLTASSVFAGGYITPAVAPTNQLAQEGKGPLSDAFVVPALFLVALAIGIISEKDSTSNGKPTIVEKS